MSGLDTTWIEIFMFPQPSTLSQTNRVKGTFVSFVVEGDPQLSSLQHQLALKTLCRRNDLSDLGY
jgi:hypothetical protein